MGISNLASMASGSFGNPNQPAPFMGSSGQPNQFSPGAGPPGGISPMQQSGLQQNTNVTTAATGAGGNSIFGQGTNGVTSVNPQNSIANSVNQLGGAFTGGFTSGGINGALSGLSSGLGNLMNLYDTTQRNVANQQYFDPQGIQAQMNGHLAQAGLGASPLGTSLQDLSANRYFNSVNSGILNANAGLMGGLSGGFMSLLSPFANEAAQEQYQNFMLSKFPEQERNRELEMFKQNQAAAQLQNYLNPTVPMQGQGQGKPILGSGGVGGSVPGSPSFNDMQNIFGGGAAGYGDGGGVNMTQQQIDQMNQYNNNTPGTYASLNNSGFGGGTDSIYNHMGNPSYGGGQMNWGDAPDPQGYSPVGPDLGSLLSQSDYGYQGV